MTVITIELIDPRVRALFENLAKMNLIKIREEEEPSKRFSNLLSKLREQEQDVPDMEEIAKDVELARTQRKENNG